MVYQGSILLDLLLAPEYQKALLVPGVSIRMTQHGAGWGYVLLLLAVSSFRVGGV